MRIKHSEYVVGCRVGDTAYIHPELKAYDKALYDAVIAHEASHTEDLEVHDMVHDLTNEQLKGHKVSYWKFILSHPKTLFGFLPWMRLDGRWVLDVPLLILWLFIIMLGGWLLSKLIY